MSVEYGKMTQIQFLTRAIAQTNLRIPVFGEKLIFLNVHENINVISYLQ